MSSSSVIWVTSLTATSWVWGRGFAGMTEQPLTLDELLDARERLIATITGDMPEAHRDFLLSFERGIPDWPLLGLDGIAALPAVQWRQQNLDKLSASRRAALVEGLASVLWPKGTSAS
jgi:hypothetical protein